MSQCTPGTTPNRLQVKSNNGKERIICYEDTVYQNKELRGKTLEKASLKIKGSKNTELVTTATKKKYENTPQRIVKIEITTDELSWT